MVDVNPYELLGVSRNATKSEIRKAYRRKAKVAHPDSGGDGKKFALVKLAHDVLTDEGRRAKYDATGTLDPAEPDNALADVLNVIMGALDNAIASCAQNGERPEQRDMIELMRQSINRGTQERDQRRRVLREAKSRLEKMRGRFKTKKSVVNFIEDMLGRALANINPQIQILDRFDIAAKAALEMLSDYTFRADQPAVRSVYEERLARFGLTLNDSIG